MLTTEPKVFNSSNGFPANWNLRKIRNIAIIIPLKSTWFWKLSNELSVVVYIGKLYSIKLSLTSFSDNFHF